MSLSRNHDLVTQYNQQAFLFHIGTIFFLHLCAEGSEHHSITNGRGVHS